MFTKTSATAALFAILPLLACAAPTTFTKRATGYLIHPNGNTGQCLGVPGTGAVRQPTEVLPCVDIALGDNVSLYWNIAEGDNLSVQLAGTNLCLDAGSNPSNNGPAKLYTCYPGLAQQRWYLTADNRIAITGGNQCLDKGQAPQTYQCTPGNTNQVWNVASGTDVTTTTIAPPITTASASSTSTPPVSVTSTSVSATPTVISPGGGDGSGLWIHPNGNTTECLTVANGAAGLNAEVVITGCFAPYPTDEFIGLQTWNIVQGSASTIQLAGTNYCLDAGSTPGNGNDMKIYTCYPGLTQQTWYYTTDNHIALYNGNQCLDVKAESGTIQSEPYGSLKNVQTWQCSGPDVNQIWTTSKPSFAAFPSRRATL